MSTRKSDVDAFIKKYQIRVRDDNKRVARYGPGPKAYFSNPDNKDFVIDSTQLDYEPLLTVEIPKSKLEWFVELERLFFNGQDDVNRRNMFKKLMEQKEKC